MTDLGTLDRQESTALCIDETRQVVGTSGSHGFPYSQGRIVDLAKSLSPDSGWKSLIPRCINDHGQIAGIGIFSDGKPYIFLMSPTP